MARIAPKDLARAVAAAKPGDRLELDAGELVGQVVIDKPLVIEGRGAGTWLGNRTGPVLIIRAAGVELRELQVEMTGDLEHAAILIEGDRELVRRNVTIRRGELRVVKPSLSFTAPPKIRLKELTPPVPARVVPPPQPRAPTQPPVRAPTQPPVRAPTQPPASSSAPVPPSSPIASPVTPGASGQIGPGRISRTYLRFGIGALGVLGLMLFGASRWKAQTSGPSVPGRGLETSPGPTIVDAPPFVDELALDRPLRTNIEVVSWSRDEERLVLELTYGRDTSNPARWRAHAVVDAPSERVLHWQDLSGTQARITAGEPGWPDRPDTSLPIEGFQSGSVLEPSQLDVVWCEKESAARFLTKVEPSGREIALTWESTGAQLEPGECREGDAGTALISPKGSRWRLIRYSPRKGGTTAVRIHLSPTRRRAMVITFDRNEEKVVVRFFTRLAGPQIYILASDEALRRDGLRRLGRPGLLLSEDKQDPMAPPSRVLVPSEDDDAYQIGLAISTRLNLPIERAISDNKYMWSDVLIVLK